MNVNEKGVKGLIKVIDDLQENGYYVFNAFDDHSPVDLVAMDKQGQIYRLQVKYRQKDSRKKSIRYEISASSSVNGKKIPINRNLIDGWAVYLADDKKIVYISKELLKDQNMLVIDPNKNYGKMAEWSMAPHC